MNKPIRILAMSDSVLLSTGYAGQMRYILEYLGSKNKYEIYHQSWHYYGMNIKSPTFEDGECLNNITVMPSGQHPWGKDNLQKYINKLNPDIVLILCDTFMLIQDQPGGIINNWITGINFSPAKSIMYYPSDGEPFPLGCDVALKKFDYTVAMAKFGQEQVLKQYGIRSHYIPHCINPNLFYKMNNKEEIKIKWNGRVHDSNFRLIDLTNKRIALFVGRNQSRKMSERLIKLATLYFKDGKNKDTIFLLKSNPNDPACGGVDMINLARAYNVADKICWVYDDWFSGFTVHEMREIYNLAEVYMSPSSGEGFGVCHIEAMSCELPVLITDYTTTNEQVDGDDRQKVKLQTSITGTFNVERGICDVEDFNKKLQYLMDNPSVMKELGVKNRRKVLSEYNCFKVLPIWEKYLEEIYHA